MHYHRPVQNSMKFSENLGILWKRPNFMAWLIPCNTENCGPYQSVAVGGADRHTVHCEVVLHQRESDCLLHLVIVTQGSRFLANQRMSGNSVWTGMSGNCHLILLFVSKFCFC